MSSLPAAGQHVEEEPAGTEPIGAGLQQAEGRACTERMPADPERRRGGACRGTAAGPGEHLAEGGDCRETAAGSELHQAEGGVCRHTPAGPVDGMAFLSRGTARSK